MKAAAGKLLSCFWRYNIGLSGLVTTCVGELRPHASHISLFGAESGREIAARRDYGVQGCYKDRFGLKLSYDRMSRCSRLDPAGRQHLSGRRDNKGIEKEEKKRLHLLVSV